MLIQNKERSSVKIMNLEDIGTQLMYTTAPIYAVRKNKSISAGTSFIFSVNQTENTSIPLLITNYHVVKESIGGYVEMHVAKNGIPSKEVVRIQFDQTVIEPNKLGGLDLVAMPLAGAINDMQGKGKQIFFKSIDCNLLPEKKDVDEFSAIEEITFIGYPSAIYDTVNKLPVIRQGITATPIWNDFKGERVFLIDAGVFPGSSGSPVFIYNRGTYPISDGIAVGSRIKFVGILKETMQRKEETGLDYLDLGVVINSRSFFDELNKYIVKMTGNPIKESIS